jgi:mono/diheme cytochrome c family protein
MKLFKKFLLSLLIVFVLAQFFGPEKNSGDITTIEVFLAETNPPQNVKQIMKESCFDCHSDVTRYPWYFNVTPVNYWIADHIEHGNSLKRKEHKMEEVWEEVKEKEMPLESYTWTHGDANLTDEQIEALVSWAKTIQGDYKAKLKNP